MMSSRELAGEVGVMLAVAALLALLGPFGTFELPLGVRAADWLVFALGGYLFFRPVLAGGEALADQSRLPRVAGVALACLLAALPTTVLVAWAIAGMGWRRLSLGDLAALYPKVLLIGAAVTIVQLLVQRARGAPVVAAPPEAAEADAAPATLSAPLPSPMAEPASFLDQLPLALGRDLLCLENEDHYVRAYTPLGSTLILMRMRDAVTGLDGIAGARVHRSWWVARAAVAGVVRRDRAVALRLTDGREVPVARAMAPELRAAGWF